MEWQKYMKSCYGDEIGGGVYLSIDFPKLLTGKFLV